VALFLSVVSYALVRHLPLLSLSAHLASIDRQSLGVQSQLLQSLLEILSAELSLDLVQLYWTRHESILHWYRLPSSPLSPSPHLTSQSVTVAWTDSETKPRPMSQLF
jgi:hypothetical protein